MIPSSDIDTDFFGVAAGNVVRRDDAPADQPIARGPPTTFGSKHVRTRGQPQAKALCRVMRAEKKVAKLVKGNQVMGSQVAEQATELPVGFAGKVLKSERDLQGAINVSYSGVVNATVASRIFRLPRSQIAKLWAAAAGAFLLAQTMLLQFIEKGANACALAFGLLAYVIISVKFDETKHCIAHRPASRWAKLRKRVKIPEQGWSVLVTLVNFRFRPAKNLVASSRSCQ